jgi:uncharacterized protein YbgA (DUF1722 family)
MSSVFSIFCGTTFSSIFHFFKKQYQCLQELTKHYSNATVEEKVKEQLSSDEKQELLEVIDHYRQEYIPLIVPITLIQHYVRKYDQPYLKEQVYLNPHPLELQLRNHV